MEGDGRRESRYGRLTGTRLGRYVSKAWTRAVVMAWLGGVAVFGVLGILLPGLPMRQLTVRAVVQASRTTTMTVYVNSLAGPLNTVALLGGVETSSLTAAPAGGVHLIQFNLYGPVGEQIRLYSVEVLDGKKVLQSFSGSDLSRWVVAYLQPAGGSIEGTRRVALLTTTQAESALRETPNVQSTNYVPGAVLAKNPTSRLGLAFWAGLGLGLVAWATDRRRWKLATVVAATSVGIVGCLFLVTRQAGALIPPTKAVGDATYVGVSISSNVRAVEATYALAGLIGVVAGLGRRRFTRATAWIRRPDLWGKSPGSVAVGDLAVSGPLTKPLVTGEHVQGRGARSSPTIPEHGAWRVGEWLRDGVLISSAVVAAAAVLIPDILVQLRSAAGQTYIPGFDSDNSFAWRVFAGRGLVPMRDFWYPYGNAVFFVAHPVMGTLLLAAVNLSVLAGFGWVFWQQSGHNRWVTWGAVMGLLLAEQFMPEFTRYSVGYLVPLTYWSIPSAGSQRRWLGRVVLSLVVGGGLFVEPDPVLYGCVGLAVSLVLDLVLNIHHPVHVVREATANLAVPFGLAIVFLIYSIGQGQLAGLWDIYGQSGALNAYAAYPNRLVTGLRSALGLSGVVVWAPALIFGAGAFLRVHSRDNVILGCLLVGVAGCGFPLLEKSAVRPILGEQRITVTLAALTVLVAAAKGSHHRLRVGKDLGALRRINALAVGGCVGALGAAIVGFAGVGVLRSGLAALPRTLRDDMHVVWHPSRVAGLEREALSDQRFADYEGELQLASVIRPKLGRNHDNLFVLGDDPSLYVILDQNPPWNISSYNASPIADQDREVNWLLLHRPRVVVFDEATPSFDDVPSDVRIPLVYQAVVANYVPWEHVGTYEVMRRRGPTEGPDATFWAGALDDRADLGFLPDAMQPEVPISRRGASPVPYLTIGRIGGAGAPGTVSVPVRFGAVTIAVGMQAEADRMQLSIPLSRIWAWPLSHMPSLTGEATDGWVARIVLGGSPGAQLY